MHNANKKTELENTIDWWVGIFHFGYNEHATKQEHSGHRNHLKMDVYNPKALEKLVTQMANVVWLPSAKTPYTQIKQAK